MKYFPKNITASFFIITFIVSLSSCTINQKCCKRFLKKAYANNIPYDAIIIPGIPYGDSSESNQFIMRSRVYWAHYLYSQKLTKNLIFSGSAVYTPYTESVVMAMYAKALGIPDTNVFSETRAEHSTENLYYSYMMGKKMGFKKIAVATDPFQARFLKKFARKKGLLIDVIPFVYDTLGTVNTSTIPQVDVSLATAKNFIALPLRETFWQRFMGTLGKKIDYTAYQD